ncbi:MAG: hypothetical protein HFF90_12910 [Oscillibacter sp.]|nr:hypothetical protein [Oscillibacter sp.]
MSVPLDTTRIGRDVQRLVEEVITQLMAGGGIILLGTTLIPLLSGLFG